MSTAVGVLILDEPRGLGTTVQATLEHMPDFHTIVEADLGGADAQNAIALIFVDEIRLVDVIDRIFSLKKRQPNLRTLVAFGVLAADDLRALLAAGADAFVARSKSPRDLGAALLALAEGSERLAPPKRLVDLPEALTELPRLTPREAEVLRFVSSGFSNKEIARRLALSVRTIETHRLNLRGKTQTGRLSDLISLARHLGLPPVVNSDGQHGVQHSQH
jgi:DNA-binding NarL/FixJ family response regulator